MFSIEQKKKEWADSFKVSVDYGFMNPQNIQSEKNTESILTEQNLKTTSSSQSMWNVYGWVIINNEIDAQGLSNQRLNAGIEKKLQQIESGDVKGIGYTPKKYLEHIDKILEE